jgi:multiple sugar transport system ATP-binding protein
MATVEFQGICKSFGRTAALEEIDFSAADGEFIVLVGPSGCGKSTALRLVAGLCEPDRGRVLIDGHDVSGVAPKNRGCAMVFQSYALYPHWTVFDNLAFPLKLRGKSKAEIAGRVAQIATDLRLTDAISRRPKELSGGQRQRVAVGRAMAADPEIFLFDEPLSNLDAPLRAAMRAEIVARQKSMGKTTLYVTHDQAEALTMADRVIVLDRGRVQGIGHPEHLYRDPPNRFVASFLGRPTINLLEGQIQQRDSTATFSPFGWTLPESIVLKLGTRREQAIQIGIRAEDLRLAQGDDGLKWHVTGREFLGDKLLYLLRSGDWNLSLLLAPDAAIEPTATVSVIPDPSRILFFDTADGHRLG